MKLQATKTMVQKQATINFMLEAAKIGKETLNKMMNDGLNQETEITTAHSFVFMGKQQFVAVV